MNSRVLKVAILSVALGAGTAMAHHSIAASYDANRPTTVTGFVTKFEWTNPHVYLFMDVEDNAGNLTPWEVEWNSTLDLKRVGWNSGVVSVGDRVTVQGILARDGADRISGQSIQLPGGRTLTAAPAERKLAPPRPAVAARETPRWPDGHPRLGTAPGERGFWADPSTGSLVQESAGNISMNSDGLLSNINDAGKVAPFRPWAKALYEYRQRNFFRDDPMAFCLPPGGPRQFEDRYGVQIIEQPQRERVMIMSAGGNRNWRIIDMDGRDLPEIEDVTPTFYGYSVGHWEDDTLVVNSQAYTERFWFSNGGLPHTEQLKLTERISRPDYYTLHYEVTVDDPRAYTRPWTGSFDLSWVPDQDVQEYFCDDNNKETEHLSGKHEAETP